MTTMLISGSGARSFALSHSAGQGVHETFQIARPVHRGDEHQAVFHHDYQARYAIHHDRRRRRVHYIVARIDRIHAALRGVTGIVGGTNALERAPRSDVVPTEVPRQHDDTVAPLEHADV